MDDEAWAALGAAIGRERREHEERAARRIAEHALGSARDVHAEAIAQIEERAGIPRSAMQPEESRTSTLSSSTTPRTRGHLPEAMRPPD